MPWNLWTFWSDFLYDWSDELANIIRKWVFLTQFLYQAIGTMYPENPEETQVNVDSINMGYISDTARNRTHNLFRPKREPIPLGHSPRCLRQKSHIASARGRGFQTTDFLDRYQPWRPLCKSRKSWKHGMFCKPLNYFIICFVEIVVEFINTHVFTHKICYIATINS